MNTEKLRKLQNFIKTNDIEDDELVEEIMNINLNKPNAQKAYWESINGKFLKKKLDDYIELIHIRSVDVPTDGDVKVTVDRYTFKTYAQNITLYSGENLYLFRRDIDRYKYNTYTEITKEEYDNIVRKLKDLAEKYKVLFSQL